MVKKQHSIVSKPNRTLPGSYSPAQIEAVQVLGEMDAERYLDICPDFDTLVLLHWKISKFRKSPQACEVREVVKDNRLLYDAMAHRPAERSWLGLIYLQAWQEVVTTLLTSLPNAVDDHPYDDALERLGLSNP